jgi:flagellar biosynthesis protein FliR
MDLDLIPALQQIWRSLGFEGDVATHIAVFGLALARLVTAVSLAPFLGGKGVPNQIKMGVAGALTVLLFPVLEPVTRRNFRSCSGSRCWPRKC